MVTVNELLLFKTAMKAILYLSNQIYPASRCDDSSLPNILGSFLVVKVKSGPDNAR